MTPLLVLIREIYRCQFRFVFEDEESFVRFVIKTLPIGGRIINHSVVQHNSSKDKTWRNIHRLILKKYDHKKFLFGFEDRKCWASSPIASNENNLKKNEFNYRAKFTSTVSIRVDRDQTRILPLFGPKMISYYAILNIFSMWPNNAPHSESITG